MLAGIVILFSLETKLAKSITLVCYVKSRQNVIEDKYKTHLIDYILNKLKQNSQTRNANTFCY